MKRWPSLNWKWKLVSRNFHSIYHQNLIEWLSNAIFLLVNDIQTESNIKSHQIFYGQLLATFHSQVLFPGSQLCMIFSCIKHWESGNKAKIICTTGIIPRYATAIGSVILVGAFLLITVFMIIICKLHHQRARNRGTAYYNTSIKTIE